jgi:hypothetical protein
MSTDYAVAVITHRRPTICAATLQLLATGGVGNDRITVFVSDAAELPAYRAAAPGWDFRHGAPGLAAQRNAVSAYYPAGQPVVCCDDDIAPGGVVELGPDSTLRPVTDLHSLFLRGFTEARTIGATLWGVYPAANAYFMRRRVATGLRFCIGVVHGVVNRPDEQLTCACKDDYERSLLRWEADGSVARLDWVAVRHNYDGTPGGLIATGGRTTETSRRDTEYLMARWPGIVRINPRRKSPYTEILLRNPARRRSTQDVM